MLGRICHNGEDIRMYFCRCSSDNLVKVDNRMKYQLLKFMCVGGSGTVLSILLLYIFTDLVGLHYILSYTISFITVVCSNYILNTLWTFKDKFNKQGLARYTGISFVTFLFRQALLVLFTEVFGNYSHWG